MGCLKTIPNFLVNSHFIEHLKSAPPPQEMLEWKRLEMEITQQFLMTDSGSPKSSAKTLGLVQRCHEQNTPFRKGIISASIWASWESPDSVQRKCASESCSDIWSKLWTFLRVPLGVARDVSDTDMEGGRGRVFPKGMAPRQVPFLLLLSTGPAGFAFGV